MNKARIAGRESNVSPDTFIDYQQIGLLVILDIKLGQNFRRKSRMVAGGHTTKTPSTFTYSSLVSQDLVRTMLTVVALNSLDLHAVDIENSYLTSTYCEKIWTKAVP